MNVIKAQQLGFPCVGSGWYLPAAALAKCPPHCFGYFGEAPLLPNCPEASVRWETSVPIYVQMVCSAHTLLQNRGNWSLISQQHQPPHHWHIILAQLVFDDARDALLLC